MQSGYLNRSVFQAHFIAFGYLNSTRLLPPALDTLPSPAVAMVQRGTEKA
jgi:hypothetical protein